MSKKYFAKYIPIEGDLESQIWQWYNNIQNTGWEIISCSDMDFVIAHGLEPAPQFRRVKLFLCSRDITPEDYLVEGKVHVYHDGSEEPFKVIGEISSDATWVKEGDEFDEDCIARYRNGKFEYFN
jgi:hypothetical protein